MTTTVKTKTKKSKFNTHLSNQYKRMISKKKETSESNTWPLDFNPFVTNKKVCPESWAILSMNH
ncbi:hypothetical protein UMM65_11595 [Aureibaculum sp. 2210JD6-5]|uniref:hypothetical protein n=1 Tax=Aureibaculum sp. 2210JD6-5 TaxID=3103957 RepID=UPI002AACE0B4|nr:hypothetical protein [Aureibaculum sp. 2210JD6-5]MDY7395891.1 hypothetical protein [Aureibaculum sp. 2210JD6-5]